MSSMNKIVNQALIPVTPDEMFEMIEDFADALLDHVNPSTEDRHMMCNLSKRIIDLFTDFQVEGRLAIITMLHHAIGMYKATQNVQPCRKDLLN